MHMAGGGMHRGGGGDAQGGGGMHEHPVHPPWVRPCLSGSGIGIYFHSRTGLT
jgi:hypothetical protein